MTELEITVARHEERIRSNETCIRQVKERMEKIEGKLDNIHRLIVGLLGGVIISLILLAVNLSTKT